MAGQVIMHVIAEAPANSRSLTALNALGVGTQGITLRTAINLPMSRLKFASGVGKLGMKLTNVRRDPPVTIALCVKRSIGAMIARSKPKASPLRIL